MDFILRNLEALGDEVAAALDDLADEVTGRARVKAHDSDMDDDGASDDRSVTSAADRPGAWGASDAGATGSDTASASDTEGPMVDPRVITLASKAPIAAQPMCGGTPPESCAKRRKAPHLVAVRIPTPPDSSKLFLSPLPPSAESLTPSPAPSPPVSLPEAREVGAQAAGPPSTSTSRMPGHARRRVPAAPQEPAAVVHSPPPSIVHSPPPAGSPSPAHAVTAPMSAATAAAPVPQPPRRVPRRRSSEFDLCDREVPVTPTVEGEFLVL